MAAGFQHSVAMVHDGRLFGWGGGPFGRTALGLEYPSDSDSDSDSDSEHTEQNQITPLEYPELRACLPSREIGSV